MNFRKLLTLLLAGSAVACQSTSSNNTDTKDTVSTKKVENTEAQTNNEVTEQSQKNLFDLDAYLKENNLSILDTLSGDLNKDPYPDKLVILKKPDEDQQTDENISRPLLILINNGKGQFELKAKNDNVVLCYSCGGVFGDPYNQMVIKNGYFSIEHYGGSNWRWTRIITFKYQKDQDNWVLHKDAGESYNTGDPKSTKEDIITRPEDFGKVSFENYKSEK